MHSVMHLYGVMPGLWSSILTNTYQIKKKGYEEKLKQDGIITIFRYGIACYKKNCKVMVLPHKPLNPEKIHF